jgi:hypothetical protein
MSNKKTPHDRVPTVFVSYSHDSPEHRRWVVEFVSRLVNNGINVMIDQWDVGPGHDLAKYMEQSVSDADRVLLICTEKYVAKANDGLGGVGYEAMIVTSELMRNLGSAKFIPIVRQTSPDTILPKALGTRYYINFGEGRDAEPAYEELLRELHAAPAVSKPPIGANPFAVSPSGAEIHIPSTLAISGESKAIKDESTPTAVFEHASKIILADDRLQWRQAVAAARRITLARLLEWRTSHSTVPPQDFKLLAGETMEGIACFSDAFALMLAAVGSGKEAFANQNGLLEEILEPQGWDRSGYVARTDLPRAASFVYQALHGAMAVHVGRIKVAIELVRKEHRVPNSNTHYPLWRHQDIMGWPESLGRNSSQAWAVLVDIVTYMPWIGEIFGSGEDWQIALAAYYIALNLNEFAELVARDPSAFANDAKQTYLDIPLSLAVLPDQITRRAITLVTEDMSAFEWIFTSQGVTMADARKHWSAWVNICNAWLSQVYRFAFAGIPHARIL